MRLTRVAQWSFLPLAASAWTPSQVALASGYQADSAVSITWLTDDPRDDADSCSEVAVAEVRGPFPFLEAAELLAVEQSAPPLRVVGTCLRYSYGSAPQQHGNYTSGRIHRVQINGLVASSAYTYSLKGDANETLRHFRTLPASEEPLPDHGPDKRFPFTLGVIGDLGQTVDSEETVRHLEADPSLQMILHAGDMSYADSEGARWDSYGKKMEPLSSRLQWMVVPGNHEIEGDYYTGETFKAYEARFAMPAVQPAESAPSPELIGCQHPWPYTPHTGRDCTPSVFTGHYDWGNAFYAFDAGPARVISLNSYTQTNQQSPQYLWLKEELEALERRRAATPWLIVVMHCPFYSSNQAHYEERQAVLMRDAHGVEELLHQHKAAVVISGHVHAYERSHQVYKNATQAGAPTYIVVGDGGNREGHAKDYFEQPSWSAFRSGLSFGHGKLLLANKTHMQWEWMKNHESRPPALDREASARRLAQLEQAGLGFPEQSPWRLPLSSRAADDSVWIVNPYRDPKPPPRSAFDNASLMAVGIVSAVAIGLVASVMVGQRCRRRRQTGEPSACAEMQFRQLSSASVGA